MVDLSTRHDDVLRENLRIDTIAVFESYFARGGPGPSASTMAQTIEPAESAAGSAERIVFGPRTRREPTWSPVVSVERVISCGVPAFEVIHRLPFGRAEQPAFGIVCYSSRGNVFLQKRFEHVVARHFVALAAFLVEPHPRPAGLGVHVLDAHFDGRADTRERVGEQGDYRPITLAAYRGAA